VAQIVSRDQPRAVSVAELLLRCAPTPEQDHDDAEPIPVSALLRREGRGTGDLPRVPDRPRTSEAIEGPPAPVSRKQLLVRRSALAAGALLAAGSAFVLTTAMHSTGDQPLASGTYPGEGALDGVADPPPTALDSGTAAPASWMPVAFPTALGGATVGKLAAAAESATHAATPAAASTVHASTVHASTTGTSTRQTTTTSATHDDNNNVVGGVADTTKGLGGTVSSVGKNTPVAGVTNAVGGTVSDVGATVGAVGSTVGDTLDSTTTPVVNGVASATTPVVNGVASATRPALSTVTGATTSATGAVTKTVAGLLG
jgi:hypothetical protein